MAPSTKPSAIVLDASAVVAFCANEAGRYAKIKAYLDYHTSGGSLFYAPGVMIAESLFVFCRKLVDARMSASDHAIAVQALELIAGNILPPLNGEYRLIASAEQIRGAHGCGHSADSLYLALAVELAKTETVELVTFDKGLQTLAAQSTPAIVVTLLT